ncbi:MAG: hypothetical protein SFW62_03020 [Alphaproteobacteria bacterium]|nr:hypothetical protein [Alphaproteobacteria bacterium]
MSCQLVASDVRKVIAHLPSGDPVVIHQGLEVRGRVHDCGRIPSFTTYRADCYRIIQLAEPSPDGPKSEIVYGITSLGPIACPSRNWYFSLPSTVDENSYFRRRFRESAEEILAAFDEGGFSRPPVVMQNRLSVLADRVRHAFA